VPVVATGSALGADVVVGAAVTVVTAPPSGPAGVAAASLSTALVALES
jgi:hypothetical protein